MRRIADTPNQLRNGFHYMEGKVKEWPVLIELVDGYNERSNKQNALIHMHFSQAEKFFGWDAGDAKRKAKWHYGLPILARRTDRRGNLTKDAEFWANYVERLEELPYEVRIEFMEKLPVTSEMSPRECKEFIDTYMYDWQGEGCPLTDPDRVDPEHYEEAAREAQSRGEL